MLRRWVIIILSLLACLTLWAMIEGVRPRSETVSIGMGQSWTSQLPPRSWSWFAKDSSRFEIAIRHLCVDFTRTPTSGQQPTTIQVPLLAVFAATALYPVVVFLRRRGANGEDTGVSIVVAVAVFLIVGCVALEVFDHLFWAYYPFFDQDYFLLEFAIGAVELIAAGVLAFFTAAYAANRVQDPYRAEPGHCASCGYNLTGNTSGVCPECGETIKAHSASPSPSEAD